MLGLYWGYVGICYPNNGESLGKQHGQLNGGWDDVGVSRDF